jgi:hypothetical protein
MTNPEHPGLTDAERLAALETYLKVLDPIAKALRAQVTVDLGQRHVEKVGAYLPDGTKMASVGYSDGRTTVKVTDPDAALKWCEERYPDEIVTQKSINPAFLKKLTDAAKAAKVGLDPLTGEMLPFIEIVRGAPYVVVTTTAEGVDRMAGLANGFAAMLEAPAPAPGGTITWADGKVTTPNWAYTGQVGPTNGPDRCLECGVTGSLPHDCETAGRIS